MSGKQGYLCRKQQSFTGVLFWMILGAACLPNFGCSGDVTGEFLLQEGDLLFQDLDGHPLCDAIEAVTQGAEGAKFSHVGIVVHDESGMPVVIEAYGSVKVTPIKEFLERSRDPHGQPKVIVGRLKKPFQTATASAIDRARDLVGTEYDDVFLLNNGKYYCSELVYECYRNGTGCSLFQLHPMTFCLPGSSEPMEIWKIYYTKKGIPVPEGKPGCNPGGISRSENLQIVHAYGRPAGWSEQVYHRYRWRVR